jgi:hypothetical protein
MKKELSSSETAVLRRATRRNFPEDARPDMRSHTLPRVPRFACLRISFCRVAQLEQLLPPYKVRVPERVNILSSRGRPVLFCGPSSRYGELFLGDKRDKREADH